MNQNFCAPGIGGHYFVIPVTARLTANTLNVTRIVNFDAGGAFLLQQITYHQTLDIGDNTLKPVFVQVTDTRRNRQLFQREVEPAIFSTLYKGRELALPRPYLVWPNSDIAVNFRDATPAGPEEYEVTLYLHGYRYRGTEGPRPPADDEDIYVIPVRFGNESEVNVLVEADYSFVLTQIVSPSDEVDTEIQVRDERITRDLFAAPIRRGQYRNPVGILNELPQPYTFTPNSQIRVTGGGAAIYLVGYKKYVR